VTALRAAWRKAPASKVHNSAGSPKIELRRRVLEHVKPARVLDVFCGPEGLMWAEAWREAESYVGIDRVWKPEDERRRFVGDNLRILRAIDLAPFNVFDLDAFGSPWKHAVILAERRRWAAGERGALVLTDGGLLGSKLGGKDRGIAELVGTHAGVPLASCYSTIRSSLMTAHPLIAFQLSSVQEMLVSFMASRLL